MRVYSIERVSTMLTLLLRATNREPAAHVVCCSLYFCILFRHFRFNTVIARFGEQSELQVSSIEKVNKISKLQVAFAAIMDLVLDFTDHYFFTPHVYPATWPADYLPRQFLSLFLITTIGGIALYLITAALSFHFVFDKRLMKHPQFLKDQVRLELQVSLTSAPLMTLPTALMFLLEVRGLSKLTDSYGTGTLGLLSAGRDIVGFLFFTDMCIYWIHRGLHHRLIYKHLHKLHHKWKIPTPFASHAFHPIDGFMQSLPYHIYPFLFPLNKISYLALFVFVNIWTVSIHDAQYSVPGMLKPYINGSAHHTDHHLYFDYNYGQYFTLWDKIGSSFKNPSAFEGRSLPKEAEAAKQE